MGLTGVIPKTRIGNRVYPIIEAGVPVLAVGKLNYFQRRLDQLAGIHSSYATREREFFA